MVSSLHDVFDADELDMRNKEAIERELVEVGIVCDGGS
jgi:hypothetical protein